MRWSYKTVHYELKKEGLLGSAFLDESEMEQSLNEYGKAGWELISMLETLDGLIAVFKQPLSLDSGSLYPREQVMDNADPQLPGSQVDVEEPLQLEVAALEKSRPRETIEGEFGLVDHYEVVEELPEEQDQEPPKLSKQPVDIGTIRIE